MSDNAFDGACHVEGSLFQLLLLNEVPWIVHTAAVHFKDMESISENGSPHWKIMYYHGKELCTILVRRGTNLKRYIDHVSILKLNR